MILDDPTTIDRYTRAGWWGQTTVGDLFRACVISRPEQVALIDPPNRAAFTFGTPQELTFAQVDTAVTAMAAQLFSAGVRKDGIVVVQLPNIAEIVIAFLACAKLGAIVSPVMLAYGERDITRIVKHLNPACVIGLSRFKDQRPADLLRTLCSNLIVLGEDTPTGDVAAMERYIAGLKIDANDIVTLHWTSGTTGSPKCVPRSHNHWHGTGTCCTDAGQLKYGDRILGPMQMVHTAGYSGLFMPWLEVQGTIVLHQPFDMAIFLDQLERLKINHTVAAPAMLNALLRGNVLDNHDVSNLRTILCGSAPLDAWMIEGYRDRYGIEIVNAFGSTEGLTLLSSAAIATDAHRRARYFPRFSGTAAKPSTGKSWGVRIAAGIEGKLIDDAGREVTQAHTPGEYRFRSPALFPGYWTADGTLERGDFDAEGYFRSGELFEIAGEGEDADHYHYIDRLKDVINRGGVKIPAGELESALQSLPGIREAAAVAYPDTRLGERVCAAVALAPDADLTFELLIDQLKGIGVAKFMLPERLEIVAALPRNATGKVLKKELLDDLLARNRHNGAA